MSSSIIVPNSSKLEQQSLEKILKPVIHPTFETGEAEKSRTHRL